MGEGEWSIILGGLGCKEHYFGWGGRGALFENAQVILLLSFKVLDFLHKLLKKLRKYYFKFFWLLGENIIGIQSFSSQLYEIIIDYLFNVS